MSTPNRDGRITVIGVPTDVNSSFMPGAALAPNHIREALAQPVDESVDRERNRSRRPPGVGGRR